MCETEGSGGAEVGSMCQKAQHQSPHTSAVDRSPVLLQPHHSRVGNLFFWVCTASPHILGNGRGFTEEAGKES